MTSKGAVSPQMATHDKKVAEGDNVSKKVMQSICHQKGMAAANEPVVQRLLWSLQNNMF